MSAKSKLEDLLDKAEAEAAKLEGVASHDVSLIVDRIRGTRGALSTVPVDGELIPGVHEVHDHEPRHKGHPEHVPPSKRQHTAHVSEEEVAGVEPEEDPNVKQGLNEAAKASLEDPPADPSEPTAPENPTPKSARKQR